MRRKIKIHISIRILIKISITTFTEISITFIEKIIEFLVLKLQIRQRELFRQ